MEVTEKLKQDHQKELWDTKTKLDGEYNGQIQRLREEFEQNRLVKEKSLTEMSEQELERLRSEKNEVISQFEVHCSHLKNKLQSSKEEVARLEKLVRDSESGLGSASLHIDNLKDALNQSKEELLKTKNDLKEAEAKYANSMVSDY